MSDAETKEYGLRGVGDAQHERVADRLDLRSPKARELGSDGVAEVRHQLGGLFVAVGFGQGVKLAMSANRKVPAERSCSFGAVGSRSVIAVKDVDEWADLEALEEGMTKVASTVDLVAVAAPDLCPLQVSVGDQIRNDPLGGSLGDPDAFGDVARSSGWFAGDEKQHVSVVRENPPAGRSGSGLIHLRPPCHGSDTAILTYDFLVTVLTARL
ncbi:MAG TPA: hypothetical protein VFI54_08000 [Solirubrobacteraceae bacterium]|nr:hypothetical protein [Solirubrobacteraceae bacterium]